MSNRDITRRSALAVLTSAGLGLAVSALPLERGGTPER